VKLARAGFTAKPQLPEIAAFGHKKTQLALGFLNQFSA